MRKEKPYMPPVWRNPPPPLTAAKRKALLAKREAWQRSIDPMYQFHRLFDLMPGLYFFAKNRKGEMMYTSQTKRDLYHIKDEVMMIGLTDFDLNPENMARDFLRDDESLYASGQPVINHVELSFDAQGMPDWFVVSKMAIRSRAGKIIGLMGFRQSYEGRMQMLQPFQGLSKAVNYIRQNYHQEIAINDLAKYSGLSERQLERKFKDIFGVGPQQVLIKTRLLAACRLLLETDRGLAEIALSCGFFDQSSFADHCRRHLGVTPTEMRRRHTAG